MKVTDKHLLLCIKSTGAWLSVLCTTVSGTLLSTIEFRDFLCTRYNVSPVNLHNHCDRCGAAFGVTHILNCIIGGLVILFYNLIINELLYLSQRAFTSACVRAKPLIHQGRTISKKNIRQGNDKHKDTQGGVMIRFLWDFQVDAIIDINIGY